MKTDSDFKSEKADLDARFTVALIQLNEAQQAVHELLEQREEMWRKYIRFLHDQLRQEMRAKR